MAKVVGNLIVTGLSGSIGKQVVIRRRKDGSFVLAAAPPRDTGRVPTPNQAAYHERFRAAIAHAKVARNDPAVIASATEHGQSAFNWAVADYLAKHPKR
ncbi:MAG TPA: hypothetical protein VIV60_27940 [Polyangiaceae bacterium]